MRCVKLQYLYASFKPELTNDIQFTFASFGDNYLTVRITLEKMHKYTDMCDVLHIHYRY